MVNYQKLDAVFAALSDPTRRRMLERLARRSMTIGEMSEGFAISAPAVSKHVKVLEQAGLLARDVVGREHRCVLQPKAMDNAASWIEEQKRFWNATLDRLDDFLATPTTPPKRKKR
jgi:DNA-binding transcriptional ArsR family regulator